VLGKRLRGETSHGLTHWEVPHMERSLCCRPYLKMEELLQAQWLVAEQGSTQGKIGLPLGRISHMGLPSGNHYICSTNKILDELSKPPQCQQYRQQLKKLHSI